ncbi:unnamed protein product [Microthlaspi erraticum]|uniref:Uncharacterized protein n=1 Tax=Microthlaspi erraticum TaxID=1685480 RepID=A0A6D2K649_9BRAS|nr:unnamed protein product [Microthlaspi erraticum]CAA7039658.1 unnamed protein product [Microthlaspi erraticum]CAA7049702.1 unnamed protein product [Microthlaspi erraticum]CAA7054333.1 unnamed protein product [Microthlaspi erraticum]
MFGKTNPQVSFSSSHISAAAFALPSFLPNLAVIYLDSRRSCCLRRWIYASKVKQNGLSLQGSGSEILLLKRSCKELLSLVACGQLG